ncbi:hypothetical protein CMV_017304 [Castanea mollissima]|uniref:Uncharacterized protein n=1 Tax=Castanea mollissima TaxID=60419 RepID=A0A8J4R4X4_9ROSI|nr:hypothetical protein CMV_017304 [Castanea mollissima]
MDLKSSHKPKNLEIPHLTLALCSQYFIRSSNCHALSSFVRSTTFSLSCNKATQCSVATIMSRVASLCNGSIKVLDAIGEDNIGAIILKFVGTAIARVTCSNHAANTNFVSNFELLYLASHFCHYTNNLMPALSNSVHMIFILDNKIIRN